MVSDSDDIVFEFELSFFLILPLFTILFDNLFVNKFVLLLSSVISSCNSCIPQLDFNSGNIDEK